MLAIVPNIDSFDLAEFSHWLSHHVLLYAYNIYIVYQGIRYKV